MLYDLIHAEGGAISFLSTLQAQGESLGQLLFSHIFNPYSEVQWWNGGSTIDPRRDFIIGCVCYNYRAWFASAGLFFYIISVYVCIKF